MLAPAPRTVFDESVVVTPSNVNVKLVTLTGEEPILVASMLYTTPTKQFRLTALPLHV
jgi:hypothetical protein